MPAADPPIPLYPAEAWPLLRGMLVWLLDHVGGMIALVRRGQIPRALWRDMNHHACALECAARQMLLAMQVLPRVVRVRPGAAPPRAKTQPAERFPGDDPRNWRVSFRLFPAEPRPLTAPRGKRPPTDENAPICARRFAARLEAVRRVLVAPGRAARRLAHRLQRICEAAQDALFDALAGGLPDPRAHEALFARTALTMQKIRDICRQAWRRRRDYIEGLPLARRP